MILTDDQQNPQYRPTGQNMIAAFQWLVTGNQPGDSLFLHYSSVVLPFVATCLRKLGIREWELILCCGFWLLGLAVDMEVSWISRGRRDEW